MQQAKDHLSGWMDYYVSYGLAVHLLMPRDKKPAGGDGWTTAPVALLEDLKNEMHLLAHRHLDIPNVGIRTGSYSKPAPGYILLVLDVDVQDPSTPGGCTDVDLAGLRAAVVEFFGCDPDQRYAHVVSGSSAHARHYYVLAPDDRRYANGTVAQAQRFNRKPYLKKATPVWSISVFGDGVQVAAPPSIHPITGANYRWGKLISEAAVPIDAHVQARLDEKTARSPLGQTYEGDMPELLSEAELPPVETLLVPDQVKQYLRGEIGPYTADGTHSGAINSVATQMFMGGSTPQIVLSILHHYCYEVALSHTNGNRSRTAIWLWKYTVRKCAAQSQRVVTPPMADIDGEFTVIDTADGGDEDLPPVETPAKTVTSIEELQLQALRLTAVEPEDHGKATRLYWLALREFGPSLADTFVLQTLKGRHFSVAAIKRAAQTLSTNMRREITPQGGPTMRIIPIQDPEHPVNRKITKTVQATEEYLLGRYVWMPYAGSEGAWWDRVAQYRIANRPLEADLSSVREAFFNRGIIDDKTPLLKWLVDHPACAKVITETFWPGQQTVVDITVGGRHTVPAINTWVPPKPPKADQPADPWLRLVELLVPQPAERKAVLDYLAMTVQHPEVKINHAILMMSRVEGAGKDTLVKPLQWYFGNNFTSIKHDVIVKDYGDWAVRKKFVVIQEQEEGSKADLAAYANFMKTYIASDASGVNILNLKYGANTYTQPNLLGFVIFSNKYLAISADEHTRRYLAIRVPEDYRPDHAWLAGLNEWMTQNNNAGSQAVIAWLMRRDLTGYNPKAPPMVTSYLNNLKTLKKGGVAGAVQNVVDNLKKGKKEFFTVKEVHAALVRHPDVEPRSIPSMDRVLSMLLDLGVQTVKDKDGNDMTVEVPLAFYDASYATKDGILFRDTVPRLVFRARPPKAKAAAPTKYTVTMALAPNNDMRNAFVQWYTLSEL